MVDWAEVLKTVGSAGVIVGVGAFFLRGIFQQLLSRDLEKFKADLAANHDIEIERLRNDLRIATSEHETRFTRLHDTRMRAIAGLYARLVRAHEAFAEYLSMFQFGGEPEHAKKGEEAATCCNKLVEYFSEKRIYFEETICADIDEALVEFKRAWADMQAYPPGMPGRGQKWSETAKHFNEWFPRLRAKIEQQFRELM